MKHKMSSLVPLALVGLVGTTAFAGFDVKVIGTQVEFTNATAGKQGVRGYRIQTQGDPNTAQFNGGTGPDITSKANFNSVAYLDGSVTAPWKVSAYDILKGDKFYFNVVGAVNAGAPLNGGIPLIKMGVCEQPAQYVDAKPISLDSLQKALKSSSYYDSTYRYSTPDTLGKFGGKMSAGFIDSYYGETQMIFAAPQGAIKFSDVDLATWEPSLIGTMTFMASSMAQEFFGMDQQWMFSIGAKETMLGSTYHTSKNTNTDYAFGPWEVEDATYMARGMGYPKFFPYDPCLTTSADVTTGSTNCAVQDGKSAAGYYHIWPQKYLDDDITHTTPLDHPKIVNALLASGWNFWYVYDLLSQSTDLAFKRGMLNSTDPLFGLCALTPIYNMGINSGSEAALNFVSSITNKSKLLNGTVTCNDFPPGNSNYRPQIMATGQAFVDAAKAVQLDHSKVNPQIVDKWITLDDVREFYFGRGSDKASPWKTSGAVQNGGLMKHFDIGDKNKEAMWNDLVAAFNLQAAHWGGGKISLRFDWLSNLRIAKKYLDFQRGNLQDNEGLTWITNHSTSGVDIDGRAADTHWPFAKFGSLTDNGDFVAEVNAEDIDPTDRGIASVEWTVNDDWTLFSTQNVKPINVNDPKKTTWQITIPAAEYQALTTGGQRTLYVRVNDSCFNSIVINTVLKGVPKPAISDASMYDYNGDGKADSLVFSGTDNGAAKFADFNDYSFDWYGSSKSGPKSDAKLLTNNQFALGDPNLGAIDESQRTGDLTLKGSWGSIVKGISDKVGPVIMSASLRDNKGDTTAKDTLTLTLNRSVSGLDTTKPASFLDFFGQSLALNGKAPVKLSVKGNRVVAIYPLNSIKAYNPNKPSEVGDSVRLTPAGVVVGASNQQPVAANNKKTPIMLDFGPLHLLPGGLHGWFDTDGDGTMDMAQIQMDRPVDDYRRDQMKLTLSWIKTAKNKVFTKTFTGSDFSFSNDLVQIKFAKSDSISPNVTYFNASATDPLKRWGAAVLVQPGYDLTDSVKMADKMGPVVVRADLKRTSTPAIRPDLLDLTFSEPLDMKATKGTALYDFRIEGQVRTAKHDANLSWKASGSAMQIAFKPEHLLRPTVGDSVHFSLQGVDGVALDSAGNKPHNANPYRPITGKPVLQVAAVTFAGLTDANANQHPQAFDTVYVLDKATNVDTLAKEMGLSGFYARLTFNDVPAGVSNLSADSLSALRNLFSVRLQANIYSKLGEWVNSYDRSFNCKDIQKLAYNSDPRLTAACDPSILLSNREFTIFVPWNFRDANSRLVGTGVYLVDLKAAASSGGKTDLDKPISIGVYRKN